MSIWESNSAVGPVTSEMIDQVYKWFLCLEERRLDAAYIAAVKECHGGILRCKKFVAGNGYSAKVGRFLNFCSSDFPPPEPFRPSYLDSTVDERLIWAMNITTGFENINIGEHLFPIAFVCDPDGDPNDVNPSHCDLICIDVLRDGAVLYWNNAKAQKEMCRCEEEEDWENLDYDLHTSRIANSFAEFLNNLEMAPEDS